LGIYTFRGIPYARPPFGPDRFREPRPPEPWDGVRDALHDGHVAPQPTVTGQDAEAFIPAGAEPGEDCLNLNVWTPDLGAAGLPVLVWITGGAFEVGSAGWYDGSQFARDGVVCVAINYRVGGEGFLHLADATPNRGLLDQIAALEWVRENIAAFGGDPGNVTVCGESAGAMSIGCLLAMPAAAGLFRRAILESGAAQHVLPSADALAMGRHLAETRHVPETRGALADTPFETLLAAQAQVKADVIADPDPARWGPEVVTTLMPFHPVVDGTIIPAHPLEQIASGASRDVDIIVGTNADDWNLFLVVSGALGTVSDEMLRGPVERFGYLCAAAYGLAADGVAAYAARYSTLSAGELLTKIQTDWWCRIPAIRLAEARRGRTWMYEFSWPSPVGAGMFGACHGLEIPFVFDTTSDGPRQMLGNLLGDEPPRALATRMHGAWVEFARHSDPGWRPYDEDQRATMRFDLQSELVRDPRAWEREFWHGRR
jgi:carboxylesterase type B